MVERKELKINYNDLRDVGWRLSELIPVDMEQKQEMLNEKRLNCSPKQKVFC